MLGKVLIPDGEAASDPSWTVLGFGAFNARQQLGNARQFVNKLRMTNSVPLGASTAPDVAVVGVNEQRALLIIQNLSTSDPTTTDIAPTFYVGFGTQAVVGQDLGLPPGVGIVMDVRTPSDAIYISIGPSVNTGGTVQIHGVVKEGGVTDPLGDTANMTESDQIRELVAVLKKAFGLA